MPLRQMDFGRALALMKHSDAAVRRDGWRGSLRLKDDAIAGPIFVRREGAFDRYEPWAPTYEDLVAEDWQLV